MKVSKEFKVGLFMVVGIVLLYLGFNFLKGIDFFSSNNRYYAVYENVDQLTQSNQVLLNGYAVGRVSDITIMQSNGNKVLVELEISSDIILGDSTIAILTGDFLGNKSIKLIIGPVTRRLEPGDTVLSALDRGIADILTESAKPVANDLQTTLRKLNVLLDNLTRNTASLDTVFLRLKTTPLVLNRTLNTADKSISEVSASVQSVSENVSATVAQLKPVMANLKVFSDSLKMIRINGTLSKVEETLVKLNQSVEKLGKEDNTLGKLMNDDELYNNLNMLLLNIDSLANHFNSNPKHFMAPLGMSRKRIEREQAKQRKDSESE